MAPDECYYIGHEPDFDQYKSVDLRTEPAPDLVIEVDITHHPIHRLALYAKLGVREVWRYDGEKVHFHWLDQSRQYRDVTRSEVLPFLSADDINHFVATLSTSGETATLRAFREWLRQPHPNS
jgi:Uma2 family endonuclease